MARAGRPKGSKNLVDSQIRSTIGTLLRTKFTAKEIDRMISKIERDEGTKKAFDCYAILMDYIVPKVARVEHTGKDGDALRVSHILETIQAPSFDALPEPDMSDVLEAQYDIIMDEDID